MAEVKEGNLFTIEGQVRAIKVRDKGYSVMVDNEWYSSFGKCEIAKGDSVKIDWYQSKDGLWKNIDKLEIIKKAISHAEISQDRTTGMLVSYVKDIVVELIKKGETDIPKQGEEIALQVAKWHKIINKEIN